jgi:hypothetical protein
MRALQTERLSLPGVCGGTNRLVFFTCDTEGYKEGSGDGPVWIPESNRDLHLAQKVKKSNDYDVI